MRRDATLMGNAARKHIKNHWFYNACCVQGWQSKVQAGGGNTSKTIGFTMVSVSRVGSPRGQGARETNQKPLVLSRFGCPGLAAPGATRLGNTSKTIGFIRLWVPRAGNPRGHTVRKHIKNHWFYKVLGAQGWQAQGPQAEETHQKPLVL